MLMSGQHTAFVGNIMFIEYVIYIEYIYREREIDIDICVH
jgi:hypothetical protein